MRRLTISLLLVVVTAVIGLGWGLDKFYGYLVDQSPDSDFLLLQETGASLVKTFDSLEDPEKFVSRWNESSDLVLSVQSGEEFQLPDDLRSVFERGRVLTLNSENGISVHYHLPSKQQVLSLSFPVTRDLEKDNVINLILTLIFYTGVILVILIWLYPLIKRLIALRKAAKNFGEGKLGSRVLGGSISFISDIETEFNRMAQRIQDLVSDNKLLSSAVSHDLKTPLSRLRFGIEALSEKYGDIERERYISRIISDLDEMESLVERLLAFARMDESRVKLTKCRMDLVKVITAECKDRKINNIVIHLELPEQEAMVNADERFIKMLVMNIVQNAVQHAKHQINVSLENVDDCYCLVVEDDGPGIPLEQRDQIVKPFVRGNADKQSKGHGLGLAIVTRIVKWHNTELKIVNSNTLGGAKIVVCLEKFDKPENSS